MGAYKDAVDRAMETWFSSEFTDGIITYNGTEILARVRYGGKHTGSVAQTAVIEVKMADVPNPGYRDQVVIAGSTWRVFRDSGSREADIIDDGGAWKIPIKRDERPNLT